MEFAKMLLQLFAEESETTDSMEEEDTIEQEYEDTSDAEEVEETEEEAEEETTEEPEKVEKTFTQEEVNQMIDKRIKRERNKLDRKYKDELSKYEELAYLTKQGLDTDDFDEALDKTRQFYADKKGIKYSPKSDNKDEEILANAYAREILEDCESVEDIEDAIQNISNKGTRLTERDAIIIKDLDKEAKRMKKVAQLSELGVTEDVYNSDSFKQFESKFNENTPISDIYELYNTTQKAEKQFKNPGSMKSVPSAEKKSFISSKDFDKLTDKEIEENMELIRESMREW